MANATEPTYGPPPQNCQCYTGTPHVNPDGSCGCHTYEIDPIKPPPGVPLTKKYSPLPTVAVVPQYPIGVDGTGTITHMPLTTDPTKAGDDGLIFGLSPLLVLGAAAVGLFLLSSMDGKN